MASETLIQPIELPVVGIETMLAEVRHERYRFLDTLLEEWVSGENRYDDIGEALCGYFDKGTSIAIGGLNCDPFLIDATIGRIRRLYVRPDWRINGIGGALVDKLVSLARQHFSCVQKARGQPAYTNAKAFQQSIAVLPLI